MLLKKPVDLHSTTAHTVLVGTISHQDTGRRAVSARTSGRLGRFSSVLLVPQGKGDALYELNSVKRSSTILTQTQVASLKARHFSGGQN